MEETLPKEIHSATLKALAQHIYFEDRSQRVGMAGLNR